MEGSSNNRHGYGSDDDFVRDRNGQPLRDRYGRPIRRRTPAGGSTRGNAQTSPAASRRPSGPTNRHSDLPQRRRIEPQNLNETRIQPAPPRFKNQDDPRFPPRGYDPDADFRHSPADGYPAGGYQADGYRAGYEAPQPRSAGFDNGGSRRRARKSAPPPQASRASGRKRRRWGLKVFLLLIIAVLAVATILVDARLTRVSAFENLTDRPGRSLSSNWLLVGSDSRAGLSDAQAEEFNTGNGEVGQRTDTIMIAHIPLVGKPKLVSIPRDSFVDIPGNDPNKINAAFAFGGPELLIDTVEKNTGIRIDHYAEIGFGGFASIVDAVGSINICSDTPVQDPKINLDIPAGCHDLDGPTALGFVRTRNSEQGDLDRVAHQREFMRALFAKMSSPTVWLNPYRLTKLVNAGTKAMFVGDGDHIWHLAWLLVRMSFGAESTTVPVSGSYQSDYAGDALLWDETESQKLFDSLK